METQREIAALLDSKAYLAAHLAYRQTSDQRDQVLDWFERSELLDNEPTVLSVGSGGGDIDLEIISRMHGRGALAYDAIEPSRVALERFTQRCHDELPPEAAARVWFQHGRFEDFEPGRRYDLIHFIHTIYSIQDPEASVAKGYRLLEQGGQMVILCSTGEGINRFKSEVFDSLSLKGRRHMPEEQLLGAVSALRGAELSMEIVPSRVQVECCFERSEEGDSVMSFMLQCDFSALEFTEQEAVLGKLDAHCTTIEGKRCIEQPMLALKVTKQVANEPASIALNVRNPHRGLGALNDLACPA